MSRLSHLLTVLVAIALLAACTRSGAVQVRGIAPLHVNDANESTPVNLRIYQLKRSTAFSAASVDDLWTKDKAVLGEELATDPITVAVLPGSAKDEPTVVQLGTLEPGVTAIGVLGLFRKPDAEDKRKAVIPLDELSGALVECAGYSLKVVGK